MLYVLASVVLAYFIMKEVLKRWSSDLHKIPSPPRMPFMDHSLHSVRGKEPREVNVWIHEWREELGFPKVMKACLMGKTMVVVADAELVRNVALSKSVSLPRQGDTLRHVSKLIMGEDPRPSLFLNSTPNAYVKTLRRCFGESFSTAGMKLAFEKQMEVMVKAKLFLKGQQGQDNTFDLQDFVIRMMLDVAGKAALDLDLGGLDKSRPLCELLIKCGRHVWALTADTWLELQTKLFPNSETAKRMHQDFKNLEAQWTRIANEVQGRSESDETPGTVAANLKKVCMPGTNDPLPFNLLRGELATAIIGGSNTTGHQLTWIFALLAANPQVVEKILDELKSHGLYGHNAKDLEFEDLSKLEYLTAAIKEGMRRIHTFTVTATRTATEDLVLDGYRVPSGTVLLVPNNYSMNSEMEWEDHLAFKPERWLQHKFNAKEKYYFPFGYGERECVGMKPALQFMKVSIVYLITKFSFELIGDTIESLIENGVSGFVFEARDGINTKVTPRAGA